jgi:hypothetical protein
VYNFPSDTTQEGLSDVRLGVTRDAPPALPPCLSHFSHDLITLVHISNISSQVPFSFSFSFSFFTNTAAGMMVTVIFHTTSPGFMPLSYPVIMCSTP